MAEKPARWQKLAALAVFIAVIVCLVVFRSRITADFWPLDNSRVGPNLVAAGAQAAVIFVALVLLWPPWRRRLHRFVDTKLGGVHSKLDRLHERHDEHAQHLNRLGKSLIDLHAKLDELTPPEEKP